MDIAIASEGVTDFAVLKNILLGWFQKASTEPFLKPIQPDPNAKGESTWQQHGNWENVIRFLREKKHRDALEFADYLIVQIDTDCSEHRNFGVAQQESGIALNPEEMVGKVADHLRGIIEESDIDFYGDRILFAICVREIECWLLPLWDSKKATKCEGCLDTLNRALAKKDVKAIPPNNKQARQYEQLSAGYRKRTTLTKEGAKNPSLSLFLEELGKIPLEESA